MIDNRLSALRKTMTQQDIDAYIMPISDPHQSEYPATHWKSLAWISGFTGSAGTVLVTKDHAGLWTDSRYFIQGEQELASSSFELHKMKVQHHPGYIDWCLKNLPEGSTVALDSPMISLAARDKYLKAFESKGIQIRLTDDLIAADWTNRPTIPVTQVFEHPIKYAGVSRTDKIKAIRAQMTEKGADYHLVTTLDDIAWIFNLRGKDVECNPVFVSYCVIAPDTTYLFIDPSKLSLELQTTLTNQNISLKDYGEIVPFLGDLPADKNLLIHRASINVQLYDAIKGINIIDGQLISRHLKAIKNDTEIGHFREVHIKDGVALSHAFYWLENTVKKRSVSEYEFAAKISECRGQQKDYFGESFSAIVGYKGNGAIIHYRPAQESSAAIKDEGILLVDSGGQYMDGTTDITRTISFTPPPPTQKNAYTRVLKGHISIAMARFPVGTHGGQLDTLARHALWSDGLNYGHGTGHGVGFFLNVHEPPQGFAPGTSGRASSVQKAGMVTSNEPGHYVPDAYGIRIENLLLTKPSSTEGFLEFETITYFPIATNLIDFSLLTKAEVQWLNDYHADVKSKLCPLLEGNMKTWMEEKCKPV